MGIYNNKADLGDFLVEQTSNTKAAYVNAIKKIAEGFQLLNKVADDDYTNEPNEPIWDSLSTDLTKKIQKLCGGMAIEECAYEWKSVANDIGDEFLNR